MAACKVDPAIPKIVGTNQECEIFPELSMSYFVSERFQYQKPFFNPINKNEFIYNFIDYELSEFKLMKYNFETKEKTEIANNIKLINQAKWSRKGWIAFDDFPSYQIWIIKDNGDSLIQKTQNKYNLWPVWNVNGDKLYWNHSPVLGVPSFFLKQGLYNEHTDSISKYGDDYDGYTSRNDVSSNNNLLSGMFFTSNQQFNLSYADLSRNKFEFKSIITDSPEILSSSSVLGLCWSYDNQNIFFSVYNSGLYIANINTKQKNKLITFCDNKKYGAISASNDGKYLIAERIDRRLEYTSDGQPTGKIIEQSSIYLIDLQTLEETKVNLD